MNLKYNNDFQDSLKMCLFRVCFQFSEVMSLSGGDAQTQSHKHRNALMLILATDASCVTASCYSGPSTTDDFYLCRMCYFPPGNLLPRSVCCDRCRWAPSRTEPPILIHGISCGCDCYMNYKGHSVTGAMSAKQMQQ